MIKTLKDIPEHMRTREWIESCIVHENHKGVHTYHMCECGKNSCRSICCADCWREILKELK